MLVRQSVGAGRERRSLRRLSRRGAAMAGARLKFTPPMKASKASHSGNWASVQERLTMRVMHCSRMMASTFGAPDPETGVQVRWGWAREDRLCKAPGPGMGRAWGMTRL